MPLMSTREELPNEPKNVFRAGRGDSPSLRTVELREPREPCVPAEMHTTLFVLPMWLTLLNLRLGVLVRALDCWEQASKQDQARVSG